MNINNLKIIPSVNFHLWEPCNMRCKFCFATFQDVKRSILPKGHLTKEDAIRVVLHLAHMGFEKITFAGGEPMLCPWLPDLIKTAKVAGMTTMIVTNGSKISDGFLAVNNKVLDWIAISVDSLNLSTNKAFGRAVAGSYPFSAEYYNSLIDKVKQHGFGLKINTVVNRFNYLEDMSEFISYSSPKRWKILQVLPVVGQNDQFINDLVITEEQFNSFVNRHSNLKGITDLVAETNKQITGSYAMVDPAGRFFDNTNGTYHYSQAILEVGGHNAIKQVAYDFDKFLSRGGIYDWKRG